ncbi:hypothetical protein ES705_43692 [subsurface metagenome]
MRKHLWAKHRTWMISRIKAGRRAADLNNPSIQDLMRAIEKGSSRAAHEIVRQMTEKRYQQIKQVMDAASPMLPLKAKLAWEGMEAAHDIYKKVKKGGK